MLLEFKDKNSSSNSSKLCFTGYEENKDVYNITAPFAFEDGLYIAGRVEKRDEENSEVVFFRKQNDSWEADTSIPRLKLQDPFVTRVNDEYVVGGVEIFDDSEHLGQLNYRTVFLRGKSLRELKRFTNGPDRMKDIRLLKLSDEKILVMTRPQGSFEYKGKQVTGGRGTIGYVIIDSLEQLNTDVICSAKLLENQFIEAEWGGCNQLFELSDETIGILSHIACFDEAGNRHYYSSAFRFHYKTEEYSPMKLIAVRNNFARGPAKRPDLQDVIFSGGLVRKKDGTAELYCGVSDCEGHMITIKDPFID